MASRNEAAAASSPMNSGVILQNPTEGTKSSSSGSSSSFGTSFAGIEDPEALAILMDSIRQMASGGSEDYKAQRAERLAQIESTRGTLGDYTKRAAFADSADLMAQNLRQSLEKTMPAIAKSIQGAGTSASSMQGLLSQKLATESAQAAGAMGAEQAKAYGGISAQLQGVLEALTRIDPSLEQNLIKALELTKIQKSSQSAVSSQSSQQSGGGGGGSYYQPIAPQQAQQAQPQAQSYGGYSPSYGTPTSQNYEPGSGYFINEDTGSGYGFSPQAAPTQFQVENYGSAPSFQAQSFDYGGDYYTGEDDFWV